MLWLRCLLNYPTDHFRPLGPYVHADWTAGGGTQVRYARGVKSLSTMAEFVRLDSSTSRHTMDKSITLPPDEIFRNLENAKRFAIDIGTRKCKGFLHCFGHFRSNEANLFGAAMPQPCTVTTHDFFFFFFSESKQDKANVSSLNSCLDAIRLTSKRVQRWRRTSRWDFRIIFTWWSEGVPNKPGQLWWVQQRWR